MMWNKLNSIQRFTPLNEVFDLYGHPKFRLGTRPVYYMGKGFLISYTSKKFRVENNNRIEFGEKGEYALSIYFFINRKELERYFKINQEEYEFEECIEDNFDIFEGVNTNLSFQQVKASIDKKSELAFYQEGETRGFINGKFNFSNKYIVWGRYTFLFFGKSNSTKLSAFEYSFEEKNV